MRIGELAARAGVNQETVRFYEAKGLLPAPARQTNGYRVYTEAHLERLLFVRHCRELDLSLEDVARLCALDAGDDADLDNVHALIEGQLARIESKIRSLECLRERLTKLQSCCCGHHRHAHCGILQGLKSEDSPPADTNASLSRCH